MSNDEENKSKDQETASKRPAKILVVDLGGTQVKVLATGQTEPRKAPSGKSLTPTRMVESVRQLAEGWEYEAISLGYPGPVGPVGPQADNENLAPGWVGFDFAAAFGMPVKVSNDAAMQALGCYAGGRMLFIGLGTGVGSTMVVQRSILPLELGQLRFTRKYSVNDLLGRAALKRTGLTRWRRAVTETVDFLKKALLPDYIMVGGGNAKRLAEPPPWCRIGSNLCAFRGGYRLWGLEPIPTLQPDGNHDEPPPDDGDWRILWP